MAEEKKEPWLNYLALSTVIFAVCATLATLKGGGYSTRSVLNQTQASDQWAFYQAKSIKENLYQLQSEKIQLEAKLDSSPAKAAVYQEAIDDYNKKVEKYAKEKADIQKAAQDLEAQRDDAKRHSAPFGLAAIPLQIAILLSSIAALLKKRALWLLALPVGLAGIVLFADGFLLFYAV
ncbi:MAG: DUF4337 domain-containing protein [Burkholderiaceae bacterium]|nr:DUF4337 domain-containing protein [Burkholderiaceae bacterium]